MSESHNHQVVLNLDGRVSPSEFLRGVRDFFDLIRSVSQAVTGEEGGIDWNISVKGGSNLIVAQGTPSGSSTIETVIRTVTAIGEGVTALESGTEERPRYFSDKALEKAKDIASLGENSKGIERVEIRANGTRQTISARSIVSVKEALGKEYTALGSVEGRLQTVTSRQGFKIVVYDSLNDKRVDCHIADEELRAKALSAFGKRVAVHGVVKYRRGRPISIRATRIRIFRPREELPKPADMRGIFRRAQ